ncbi:MAG: hypothetical protein ACKOPQ_01450 [Novosphingobium sp.]
MVPMLWAFFGLAALEFCAVHLFVTLKWPSIGWPLTIVSGLSLIWLIGWIRSWPRMPHQLDEEELVLNLGSLRSIRIPTEAIVKWGAAPSLDDLAINGMRKFTVLAAPNRFVATDCPVPGLGKGNAVAFQLDDPALFDAAIARTKGLQV